ncbi:Flagellin N-methylase [Poriferisphaera corsica]|uniref:Flagellin N-methylase n=1 Tax=Poriferisphaera corsica TaxID=2528020 RepID=A0A517YRX8_9BACT|nr:YkgJ family cysteine cluster protein [Poriferisphaera corsica]QDU32975.1 Flagellin N-methylase [Poriferisphaera corsica]
MTQPPNNSDEWYKDGLSFECSLCGNCCTGAPGFVWFNEQEADEMATILNIDAPTFLEKYAHKKFGRWTLNEVKNEKRQYDCVFLIDLPGGQRGCKLYKSRPTQCRTWPFWPENLKSSRTWKNAAKTCPGMRRVDANFYPVEDIRIILNQNEF